MSLSDCTGATAQLWKWNPTQGALISGLDNSQCVSINGQATNDAQIVLDDCTNSNTQIFEQHANNTFRLKNANQYALDAASNSVVLWQHHGNSNQRWYATQPQ